MLPLKLADPSQVRLGGLLGQEADRSARARLHSWIRDCDSPAVRVFRPPFRESNTKGDWYGEHAGKWMIAGSRAARRRQDGELADRVLGVARGLLEVQEDSGILSAYPKGAACRFDKPADGRTWDVWIQAYTMLGLLEAEKLWPGQGLADAAVRAAEALADSMAAINWPIRSLGNHGGLSASVVLEPVCALGMRSGSPRLRAFADRIVQELESDLIAHLLGGQGVASVATGKIYQILWNLVGLLRYHEWTGEGFALTAAIRAWEDIRDHHLTPGGGPWGGVAGHKETFNPRGYFSPYGMVEVCSTWSWMQLSRDLYRLTGDSRYLDAVECSAYNQLLGAMDANGEDWSYFTFPNGRRNPTYDWACCKSSGAAAWEEIAPLTVQEEDGRVRCALLAPFSYEGPRGRIGLEGGPLGSMILATEFGSPTELWVRRPGWASSFQISREGEPLTLGPDDGWARVMLPAGPSKLEIVTAAKPKVVPAVASLDHHGQEIQHMDYFAVTYGPFAMATGLIEGYKREETVRLARLFGSEAFQIGEGPDGLPRLVLVRPDGPDLEFDPYFLAGGREMGRWRSTWLQVAWQ